MLPLSNGLKDGSLCQILGSGLGWRVTAADNTSGTQNRPCDTMSISADLEPIIESH